MPITTAQIDALPDYTTAQRLKMYRAQEMSILAAGQSYDVDGQQKTAAALAEVRKAIKELEAEVEAEDSTSGNGFGLIEFGRDS